MKKSKRGRPAKRDPKFTAEVRQKILTAVALDAPMRFITQHAGVDKTTVWRWRKKDKKFAREYEEARADAVISNLMMIKLAARKNWTAAAWLLERRHPDLFGKQVQQIEHTGKGGKELPAPQTTVQIAHIEMTDPDRIRKVLEIAKELGVLDQFLRLHEPIKAVRVEDGNGKH